MAIINKALIYCRVSSQKQVDEGSGLSSQEQRCREYCRVKGYKIDEVFRDEGISGGLFERPGMKALLAFADKNATEQYVVVFDDLKRFARDIEVHLKLRREFDSRGIKIESPNFSFNDTEEGRYVEGIFALTAQLERGQNRRQVIQKQKARLEQGYWPFCNPPGLKFIRSKEHGKLLIPDEILSIIYKEAIEKYANNLLRTQTDVTEFIKQKYKQHGINKKISNHGTNNILKQILYAGYIEYKHWDIDLMKGKHQGFITYETYNKVQKRLAGINKTRPRKNYLEDFALRGFLYCPSCGKPYTASWNTGRSKKYGNYCCKTLGCEFRWKSISKNEIHSAFRRVLKDKRPLDPSMAKLVEAVLLDIWNDLMNKELVIVNNTDEKQQEYLNQIDSLVELVSKLDDFTLIDVYQKKIKALKIKIEALNENSIDNVTNKYTQLQFGTALKQAIQTLENPLAVWKNSKIKMKRNLINFYFDKPLMYSKENGFGTVEFRYEINVLSDIGTGNFNMVEMGGVEPPY